MLFRFDVVFEFTLETKYVNFAISIGQKRVANDEPPQLDLLWLPSCI